MNHIEIHNNMFVLFQFFIYFSPPQIVLKCMYDQNSNNTNITYSPFFIYAFIVCDVSSLIYYDHFIPFTIAMECVYLQKTHCIAEYAVFLELYGCFNQREYCMLYKCTWLLGLSNKTYTYKSMSNVNIRCELFYMSIVLNYYLILFT